MVVDQLRKVEGELKRVKAEQEEELEIVVAVLYMFIFVSDCLPL